MRSDTAALVFLIISPFLSFFILNAVFQTSSRLTWAFARGKALFLSRHFEQIHPTLEVPVNATILNWAIFASCGYIFLISTPSALFNKAFHSLKPTPNIPLCRQNTIDTLLTSLVSLSQSRPPARPLTQPPYPDPGPGPLKPSREWGMLSLLSVTAPEKPKTKLNTQHGRYPFTSTLTVHERGGSLLARSRNGIKEVMVVGKSLGRQYRVE